MTTHKIVVIECNGCGTTALPETLVIKDLINLVMRPDSVTDARHHAAAKGWRHTVSGNDLCPDCQSVQRAPVKTPRSIFHGWGHGR